MLPINLNKMDKKAFTEWLNMFDVIFTDCDAVLWHDNVVIPQVPETINALQSMGKQIYFITNNSTKTRQELWLKANQMNYNVEENQIIAPSYSVATYLKLHLKPDQHVYVIGGQAIAVELNKLNIRNFGIGEDVVVEEKWIHMLKDIDSMCRNVNVGAVVVGFDEHFSFAKMLRASSFLKSKSCHFLCTNSDAVHKYPNYCIPGTGAILEALETCVQRKAQVMGKPNPLVCKQLIKSGAVKADRTLMIGDSPAVDVEFGKNCGFQTLLVGTGYYKWSELERLLQKNVTNGVPNYYADSLGDLYEMLRLN